MWLSLYLMYKKHQQGKKPQFCFAQKENSHVYARLKLYIL
jgi:hypothetical protein